MARHEGGRQCERTSGQASASPPVDPRFASADSLVDLFNELTTTEPADLGAVVEFHYAESDWQRTLVDHYRNFVQVLELHEVMSDRLGEGYFPGKKDPAFAPYQPATITERSPQRATATYRDGKRTRKALQLVQVGDRWWLSGYTLEGDPEFENLDPEDFAQVQRIFRSVALASRQIIDRIEGGEFSTANEARAALWQLAAQERP